MFRFLRSAFGFGGPAATRQTGFIARAFYLAGLGAALLWLLIMYLAVIRDHALAVYSLFDERYVLSAVAQERATIEQARAAIPPVQHWHIARKEKLQEFGPPLYLGVLAQTAENMH